MLLAQCLASINLGEDPSIIDKKWIKNLKKEANLPFKEKELIQYLLEPSTKKRVNVTELLTNHYFLQILKYKKDLGPKLFKSYNLDDYKAREFELQLVKRITEYEKMSQLDTKKS